MFNKPPDGVRPTFWNIFIIFILIAVCGFLYIGLSSFTLGGRGAILAVLFLLALAVAALITLFFLRNYELPIKSSYPYLWQHLLMLFVIAIFFIILLDLLPFIKSKL